MTSQPDALTAKRDLRREMDMLTQDDERNHLNPDIVNQDLGNAVFLGLWVVGCLAAVAHYWPL